MILERRNIFFRAKCFICGGKGHHAFARDCRSSGSRGSLKPLAQTQGLKLQLPASETLPVGGGW